MSFELRMLGPLTVLQDGRALELPVSRKARALLAYLALSPRAVLRGRLTDLLFDDVSDPRGELRWCLSKLRGVMGARIQSLDQSVRLELADCLVDAQEVQQACSANLAELPLERVRELLEHFRGAFLEGLQVDGCPEIAGWLLMQRRAFHAWHVALLQRLIDNTPDGESLGYVEKWLELAPHDLRAHELLLEALARAGRIREGEQHLSVSLRLFKSEGLDGSPMEKAWRKATRRNSAPARTLTSASDSHSHDYCLKGRQHLARMMKHGLDSQP